MCVDVMLVSVQGWVSSTSLPLIRLYHLSDLLWNIKQLAVDDFLHCTHLKCMILYKPNKIPFAAKKYKYAVKCVRKDLLPSKCGFGDFLFF